MKWTTKDEAKLKALDLKIGAGKATRQQVLAAIDLKRKRAACKALAS